MEGNMNIKGLIKVNKDANENIAQLEELVEKFKIENEKDKANFGNICVALRGHRMVADATEAMLINEGVIKDYNGEFYVKIPKEKEPENKNQDNKETEDK